jgi:hypothetical protein
MRSASQLPGQIAVGDELDALAGRRLQLGHGRLGQIAQVARAGHDRDAAVGARAREVEQLIDEAPHALGRLARRGGRVDDAGRIARPRQRQVGGDLDALERPAQVVAEHGDEHVAQPQHVVELSQLLRQLLLLPVELDEGLDLAAQEAGIDRLVQEVDRPGLVPLERARALLGGRRDEDDRDVPGALRPAHQLGQLEAAHAGHVDVDESEGEVVDQERLERLVAGPTGLDLGVAPAERGRQRDEVPSRSSTRSSLTGGAWLSWRLRAAGLQGGRAARQEGEPVADRRDRKRAGGRHRAQRRVRHEARLGRVRVLDPGHPARRGDRGQAGCPIRARPGEEDTEDRDAEVGRQGGKELEQDGDAAGRSAEHDRFDRAVAGQERARVAGADEVSRVHRAASSGRFW